MSNIRLFFEKSLSLNFNSKLDKTQSHYLSKVMRINVGQSFSLFNQSGEWEAKVQNIVKGIVEFSIIKKLRSSINKSFDQAVDAIVKCQSKIILCGVGKSYLIASKISATGVVLHTGSHKGLGIDAVSDQVIQALIKILDETPTNTKLALENMAGQGGVIGATFEELGMLLDGVNSDRLGVCFDTCHAFAAGYDISNSKGVDNTMNEFDAAIGFEKLLVVHANDSLMELGGNRDRHENIGQGFIGDDGFKAILGHSAFAEVPFLLEVPGYPTDDSEKGNGPDLQNVNHLKKLRDS